MLLEGFLTTQHSLHAQSHDNVVICQYGEGLFCQMQCTELGKESGQTKQLMTTQQNC